MNDEKAKSWCEFAKEIKAELRKGFDVAVRVGELFLAAKRMLPHGDFQYLFLDLPIGQSMAQKYMKIASNLAPIIRNAEHVRLLPTDIWSLCFLSGIEPLRLQQALMDKSIRRTSGDTNW